MDEKEFEQNLEKEIMRIFSNFDVQQLIDQAWETFRTQMGFVYPGGAPIPSAKELVNGKHTNELRAWAAVVKEFSYKYNQVFQEGLQTMQNCVMNYVREEDKKSERRRQN